MNKGIHAMHPWFLSRCFCKFSQKVIRYTIQFQISICIIDLVDMFIFHYTVFRNSSTSDEYVFFVALHFTTGQKYLTYFISRFYQIYE